MKVAWDTSRCSVGCQWEASGTIGIRTRWIGVAAAPSSVCNQFVLGNPTHRMWSCTWILARESIRSSFAACSISS
jgi:hypothetical protein